MTNKQKDTLFADYKKAAINYVAAFCKKQDVYYTYDLYDFGYFDISDYFISIGDIIYDINNDVPVGKIFEYYGYIYDIENSEISYHAWLGGMRWILNAILTKKQSDLL